ncbi:MAG TPA: GNAT family acetyltransferase [Verrucomicrobiae bacterium]|jgi:ribosomal protein S18 acetylase RimI-like enzyme
MTAVEAIVPFDEAHRGQLAELWQQVFGYTTPHNEANYAIDKKLALGDGLLSVAVAEGKVVGSIMAGYDGHRGWIYSVAVMPGHRGRGLGSRLMRHAEEQLASLGCPKINLQILQDNEGVESFYRKLGYQTEMRVNMGKLIPKNIGRPGAGAATGV